MQGALLNVRTAQSLILGDDGERYTFTTDEWQNPNIAPQVGMRVDFEVRESEAVNIFPVPGAAPAPPATSGVTSTQPPTPTPAAGERKLGLKGWHWALAGGVTLIVLGIVGALVLGVFPTSGSDSGTFSALLSRIPDTPGTRQELVSINDFTKMRERLGISLPDAGAGDDELWDYLSEVNYNAGLSGSPYISGYSRYFSHRLPYNDKYLAFGLHNEDQTALADPQGATIEVIRGRFDPESTERALEDCRECPPPERMDHKGVVFYAWSEDFEGNLPERNTPPAFDHLGRGGRIAILDSYLFRTLDTAGMKTLIDLYSGEGPSLGDHPDLALAAAEMDRLDLYAGTLMGDTEFLSLDSNLEVICQYEGAGCKKRLEAAAGVTLGEYDALALGSGQDESGPFTVLIFVYGSKRDAVENEKVFMEILEQGHSFPGRDVPWREFFPDEPRVTTKDRMLVAQLPSVGGSPLYRWLYEDLQSLLWHR